MSESIEDVIAVGRGLADRASGCGGAYYNCRVVDAGQVEQLMDDITAALERERANMGEGVAMMLQERNAALLKIAEEMDTVEQGLGFGVDLTHYVPKWAKAIRAIAEGK